MEGDVPIPTAIARLNAETEAIEKKTARLKAEADALVKERDEAVQIAEGVISGTVPLLMAKGRVEEANYLLGQLHLLRDIQRNGLKGGQQAADARTADAAAPGGGLQSLRNLAIEAHMLIGLETAQDGP